MPIGMSLSYGTLAGGAVGDEYPWSFSYVDFCLQVVEFSVRCVDFLGGGEGGYESVLYSLYPQMPSHLMLFVHVSWGELLMIVKGSSSMSGGEMCK
ncbi:hypothetical protein F2Q68_00032746 [Brassica cretica]|uniref:Uncharacterized protein n=2 Tax=Brassica cretica TaxID=69181 RepID=A0ABQ7BDT1_BRACR|nr:hypothetical protein F2Q68_00032746 [Brassica cretica]KAF3530668.1 hypothetical protein DY000_02043100 [Brassica cretica]